MTRYAWKCPPPCGAPYDKGALEGALVAALEKASMGYQGQDLVCSKCYRTRASAVRRACECGGGGYANTIPPGVFGGALGNFRRLAALYDFPWLKESVDWLEGRWEEKGP